ncbi:MAG: hypothetical protein ABIO21_06255 [Pseudomonas sp.]
MALYARVEGGVAVELIDTGEYAITQLFAPSFLSSMILVPDGIDVELGQPIDNTQQDLVLPPVQQSARVMDTPKPGSEALADLKLAWRQSMLCASQWLLNRHRDEQELGRVTTLTVPRYLDLLEYRQALRDWPSTEIFPATPPLIPDWLAEAVDEGSTY